MTTPESDSVLAEVRSLAPSVAARATEIEAGRRLPLDLVERMARAGLFRVCVPQSLGGCETEVTTLLEAVETLSAADGAAGWCLMIGATTGLLAGFLPEAAAKEIYGRDPDVVTGGVFAPRGEARAVDGGYRVTGRWPFASGCEHCAWLAGGCTFGDGTAPRMLFFPASDVEIVDTWTVSGLAGTGSHDMVVDDVLVPAGREVAVASRNRRRAGSSTGSRSSASSRSRSQQSGSASLVPRSRSSASSQGPRRRRWRVAGSRNNRSHRSSWHGQSRHSWRRAPLCTTRWGTRGKSRRTSKNPRSS